MTAKECLFNIAAMAYDAGLISEQDVKRMMRVKSTKTNECNYYRALWIFTRKQTKIGLL